jgi:hypothetical protein
MPLYDWKNIETGEEFENFLTMEQREQFKKDHPELKQLVKKFTPVAGVGGIKTSEGFKDVLRNIKKKTHNAVFDVD